MPPIVGQPTTAAGDESDPAWVVKTVRMNGTVVSTLADADVDTITWTLNAPDEATFHFPKGSYSTADLGVLTDASAAAPLEVQIYRNGDLQFWGPIVSITSNANSGQVDCHCAGVDWYLNRRFVDGPVTNLIVDGDFLLGTALWPTAGGVSASGDSTNFQTGSESLQLTGTGGDQYVSQFVTSPSNGVGLLMTVSGWVFVDSITAPPYQTRGLYIEARESGVFKGNNYQVIDMAPSPGPIQQWHKMSTTISVPPNTVYDLEVRLYAPIGTVHWDDVKLVAMDSLSTAELTSSVTQPVEIADIVALLVRHMQRTTAGKSNVNITSNAETTGVKLVKTWQYVDHVQFDQALHEFILRGDGLDYVVNITPTTRTFHTFANKREADLTGSVTLIYDGADPNDAGANCAGYRLTQDGGAAITRQTVLGADNGPDREQAEAVDTSSVPVILQDVKQSPQGTAVASLEPLATEQIGRYGTPGVPLTIEMDVLGSAGFIPTIRCGSLVTAGIIDGWTQVSTTLRVMRLSLDRRKNLLTVTLAREFS